MMARSHVAVGLATWVTVAPTLHYPAFNALYLAAAVLGALLPDIDHPGSWVGRRTRPFSSAAASLFGHRGITHSALALMGGALLLTQIDAYNGPAAAVSVGYLSHLAADLLTPSGLRLAWPLRRRWAVPLCRTGSPAEPLIVLTLVVATALRFASRWHH